MKAPAQDKAARVYLFSGEDEFLLQEEAKGLVAKLLPAADQTLGLEAVEGRARLVEDALKSISACIEAVRTPGFMGARKVVWLKNANFFDRGLIARSSDVSGSVATLAKIIKEGLPGGNILVVTAGAVDRAAAFYKACQAAGEVRQQAELKPWDKDKAAAAFARSALQKNKIKAGQDVVEAIVALAGAESRQLLQEADKLALFIHPRQEAEREDVVAIVSSTRESNFFHLADAAGARDLKQALEILRRLIFQKESEIGLVMGLEARFRQLLILREMISEKTPPEEKRALEPLLASEKGRPPQGYYLERLVRQARNFSLRELAAAREAILETRLKLVSSSNLETLLMEKLLVQICGRRKAS